MSARLKNQLSYFFFILLAVLAFYTVFQDNDMAMVAASLKKIKLPYLLACAAGAPRESEFCRMYPLFLCRFFVFRHYAFCYRRTADAALSYEA